MYLFNVFCNEELLVFDSLIKFNLQFTNRLSEQKLRMSTFMVS